MKVLFTYRMLYACSAFILLLHVSCKKLVYVDEPRDSITEEKIFQSESGISNVLAGIYTVLINGSNESGTVSNFGSLGSTLAGGFSSGELIAQSKLWQINETYSDNYWRSAYHIVYLCNSLLEGVAGSTSEAVRDSVKMQYMAEARLIRAFSFLYLTSFFGDVPLVLTTDFNETKMMPRTPIATIYDLIREDLYFAEENLPLTYAAAEGKRIRANAWVAKALLARTFLYEGNFEQAALYATEVINHTSVFQLEPLSRVFLADSREAVFQLMQTNQSTFRRNATPEGARFLPNPLHTGTSTARLSLDLLDQFVADDQRKVVWLDSTLQTHDNRPRDIAWYPSKYKVGLHNAVLGAPPSEYYVVIRLAELYLIRAEARAFGADGGAGRALEDLNLIRNRAGLAELPSDLSPSQVQDAVWSERRKELFAEWGHYWIDLKRSGRAIEVLSKIPNFLPWDGDWQLLYPIPESEILVNRNLKQNPGYDDVRQ